MLTSIIASLVIQPDTEFQRRFQRPGLRNQTVLKVGQEAPNFKLKYMGKKEFFELATNKGKLHTVLIFGSYT